MSCLSRQHGWILVPWVFLLCAIQVVFAANSNFRLDLARRMVNENRIESAIEEYKKYLGENPQSPHVYHELAKLRIQQKKFKLAIFNLRAALKLNPDFIDAQEELAITYEKIKDTERALAEWRKLATISTNSLLTNRAEMRIADLMAGTHSAPDSGKKEKGAVIDTLKTSKGVGKEKKLAELSPSTPDSSSPIVRHKSMPKSDSIHQKKSIDSAVGIKDFSEKKYFQKAEELIKKKQYGNALAEIGKILKQQEDHPGAYYLAGVVRFGMGDLRRARINFKYGLKYPEKGYNGYFYLGRIYAKQGKKKEAIKAFQEFVRIAPSDSLKQLALEHIARLKNSKSPSPKALTNQEIQISHSQNKVMLFGKSCRFIIPDSTQGPVSGFLEAHAYLGKGRPEKASKILKKIIMEYGGSNAASYAGLNLASIYYHLQLYDNVLDEISEFLTGNKTDNAVNYAKYLQSLTLIKLNQAGEAKKILAALNPHTEYGPTKKEVYLALSNAFKSLKDYSKAISQMRKAGLQAENEKEKAGINFRLAELTMMSGNAKQAVSYLQRAMAHCADTSMRLDCASAFVRIADNFSKRKQWKSALKYYKLLESQYPDHKEIPWSLYQIGNIYMLKGEYKLALEHFRNLIGRYPDNYWSAQAKWKQEDAIWQSEYKEVLY